MTEEQRHQQKIKIEAERNKCLKGIWDELKSISALLKVQIGVSPVCDVANFSSTIKEDLEKLADICRPGYILTKEEKKSISEKEDIEELKEKLYKARDGMK